MKVCSKCKVEKSLDCFVKRSDTVSGYAGQCKVCVNARKLAWKHGDSNQLEKEKEYYRKNSDKIKARASKWVEENSERAKERRKQYYAKNRESAILAKKQYYENNKETIAVKVRQYYLKTKAARVECAARHRANKRKATPSWLSSQHKSEIAELFSVCEIFRLYTGLDYHVDHIVPLKGKNVCGLHVPWNLQVLEASRNRRKSNKFEEV